MLISLPVVLFHIDHLGILATMTTVSALWSQFLDARVIYNPACEDLGPGRHGLISVPANMAICTADAGFDMYRFLRECYYASHAYVGLYELVLLGYIG